MSASTMYVTCYVCPLSGTQVTGTHTHTHTQTTDEIGYVRSSSRVDGTMFTLLEK